MYGHECVRGGLREGTCDCDLGCGSKRCVNDSLGARVRVINIAALTFGGPLEQAIVAMLCV